MTKVLAKTQAAKLAKLTRRIGMQPRESGPQIENEVFAVFGALPSELRN